MYREIVVVKYGSSSVTNQQGMDSERLLVYAGNLAELYNQYNLVVVSSGAVAMGRYVWSQSTKSGLTLSDLSAAMMGSAEVVVAWKHALNQYNLQVGQLLITDQEIDDSTEGPRLQTALKENLGHGIITIANENDALCDKELKKLAYGEDNDGLAAHIAIKLGAFALCLMTDTDGLRDTKGVIKSVGISDIERQKARSFAGVAVKGKKGGGRTKTAAGILASDAGIDAYWANAHANILDVLAGKSGTHFVARAITQ